MKKLMFYINTLGTGGAERVISQLAGHFHAAGCEVIFVTSFPVAEEYPLADGILRISLESQELQQSRLMRNMTRIKALRKLCKEHKPDALIAFMQEPNFRAILAAWGLPVKTVVSVRNDPKIAYAGKVGKIVGKVIMPMADGCVFQTEQAKQWFPKRLQAKSAIILNEVTESFFRVQRTGAKNVVSVGRLNAQKNQAMLIRAFAGIAHKHPEHDLLIYGEGDCRASLQALIESLGMDQRIHLMGKTADVQSVLAEAAVFALSSDYEGMPNALMEALAAGVPCVSTDCPCGGPEMLVENGENGILVPVDDETAFADAMDRLLSDPALANKMGEAAHASASRFASDVVFEKWQSFVNQCIEEK